MKLRNIKNIWQELNREIFAAKGMPLSEDVIHFKTRSNWAWAFWSDNGYYYWNHKLEKCPCKMGLILHEMVHQWQHEYLPFSYGDLDSHDVYFNSWQIEANKRGWKL